MRVTRCFSFDPVADKPLLEYIDRAQNASAEVRELLRLKLGISNNDTLLDGIPYFFYRRCMLNREWKLPS